jgi:hypothetical protein
VLMRIKDDRIDSIRGGTCCQQLMAYASCPPRRRRGEAAGGVAGPRLCRCIALAPRILTVPRGIFLCDGRVYTLLCIAQLQVMCDGKWKLVQDSDFRIYGD